MAINTPHGEKAVQRPSGSKTDDDNSTEDTQNVASGSQHEASNEDFRSSGTISSLSSQENLPSALSSPFQVSSPLPSPSQRHSFNPSPSQLDSPLSSPYLQPSLLSSSSSLQSPPGSLPSPYERGSNISIEQLNELALQDSENNNVDENSNQGFDQYAEVAHDYTPDQSVRPRVRAQYPGGRDQSDGAPVNIDPRLLMRRRSSGSNNISHRRNLSEDLACSPTTNFSYFDDESGRSMDYDRLPRLPNLESDRRESWSSPHRLPRRDDPSFFQSVRRILPLNLRGGGYGPQPPPLDNTIEEDAQDLLSNFTSETLVRNCLPNPNASIIRQGYRNPSLYKVGRELRMLADAFAETEERKNVKRMAESVYLESINMENFFQLCTELFMGGITRERIVALFTFVGDVAVFHVRRHGQQFLQQLMKWSWRYLVDHVCKWVKEAGGWGAVLSRGANALYAAAVFAFCFIGTVAAGVYIVKTLKDW